MNTKIAALALLLLASAAPAALAQERDPGAPQGQGGHERRDERDGERPTRPGGEARDRAPHAWRQPAQVPQVGPGPLAPQAPAPRPAAQPRDLRGDEGGGRRWVGDGQRPGPRPDARRGPEVVGDGVQRRPGTWIDTDGDSGSRAHGPPGHVDRGDRQGPRDAYRYNGGRVGSRGPETRLPEVRAYQGDRRWRDEPPDVRRADRDHVRDDDRDHDRDRDRRDRQEWRPGAYPRSFHSERRYHVREYRRPPQFFVHSWRYGEFLPSAWFAPDYLIEDWWGFDLPAPPPGYDWVRVGDDALLVDEYTGRIVQVVRYLFW